ncbi:uncharacterized protein METZ01_LOCUS430302 [marine metagenome]|uniref:GtrA/DPMS transmembrane domain-containing protein n=1 Tax=marine metagenome TaxID=408172 RepID=A0A382Y4N3_9ZZZZ
MNRLKFFKYSIIGGISALIDWGLFFLMAIIMEINFIVAATISFILATSANYLMGINFLFHSQIRFNKKEEIILIFFISLVGLGINLTSLYILSVWIGLGLMVSKVISSLFALSWNFSMRNNFVFKKIQN